MEMKPSMSENRYCIYFVSFC